MTHDSHKMRYTDSSYGDEICDNCMELDPCTHTNEKLVQPCTKPAGKVASNKKK